MHRQTEDVIFFCELINIIMNVEFNPIANAVKLYVIWVLQQATYDALFENKRKQICE